MKFRTPSHHLLYRRPMGWCLGVLFWLCACGPPPTVKPSTTPPPAVAIQSESEAMESAHRLTDTFADLVKKGPETLLNTIFLATQLSRSDTLVKTGTVKQSSVSNQFSYAAQPVDRLVLDLKGRRSVFEIRTIKGKLDASSQDFLFREHTLVYRMTDSGDSDLTVQSTLKEGAWAFQAKGKLDHELWTYVVDLRGKGSLAQTVLPTRSTMRWDFDLQGTVARRDLRLTLQLKRLWEQNVNSQPPGTTTTWKESWGHTMLWGGETYRWNNCGSERTFQDGVPASPGKAWKTTGTVNKGSELYGAYKLETAGPEVKLQFLMPFGESFDWKVWKR